jgi:diguanylate cyclase (GGDEF)-like protein
MERTSGESAPMRRSKRERLRRVLLHGAMGAVAGYFILHPLSMLIHARFYGTQHDAAGFLASSFSAEHVTMAIYFACLGAIAGMIQGLYSHRLRELYEEAKALSITDELTSLYNRRHLMHELGREIERARRSGRPLSMLMIDIDHFKRYNDTHGHQAGDSLLKAHAQTIAGMVRETDTVARYGGEEFVVLMPGTAKEAAYLIAERLRAGTAKHLSAKVSAGDTAGTTVSIGVGEYAPERGDEDRLLNSADSALYRAKKLGRNRVEMPGVQAVNPEQGGLHALVKLDALTVRETG